ncbi:putative ribonuclease H-like domain-containing protein [Tanacetum coccineum]|uniref:Ribonuclease H-like domain-containing protein n=1 Tax=Tanacetum coccineum TaxID=301880 RepID=A0ABQ5EGS0_9ASTR
MIRLRAETPSTSHPLSSSTPPSGTPPLLPIPLPTSSPPLLLPSTDYRADKPEVCLPPPKRLCIALGLRYEVSESLSAPTTRPTRGFRADYGFVATLDDEIKRDPERDVGYGITDTWDKMLVGMLGAPATDDTELGRQMTEFATMVGQVTDEIYGRLDEAHYARAREDILSCEAWGQSMDASDTARSEDTADTGVADALAAHDTDKSMNGDDSHNSGTGGIEGVIELTQWFERMETVFRISNCFVKNQIKFATCTLLGSDLTWWNSYVKTVGHGVAHAMTWINLKKKMTDKYCPRGEIKKLEVEMWNLKVKGTDVSMRMEQYLTHTDYALWEVIVNGDAPAVASASIEGPIPPKTAEQKIARKNELKATSTLLLAILDEHLLKFHGIKDEKSLWEAIKTRFQKLISQLEIHGEVISQEDANLKLLRSLPLASNNIAMIMRNKPDLDTMSMDDLYNSLKGQASSSSYADDVMFSFFVSQYNSQRLDNEDLEQIDIDDLDEMDLKWHLAMLTMRVKRFLKKTERNLNFNGKESAGFDKTKVECYNCHRRGHFARECRAPRNQGNRNGDVSKRIVPIETPANALVVQDGIGSSISSSSESEVSTCSKACLKSYESLKEHFDKQKEQLKKSNLEIIGYQSGLESLEARIVVHEKNEASYEERIAFLKYDVQVKDISNKNLKNQLEEALKEKDDLKLKLQNFEESLKNQTKLINSQISVKDKTRLRFDSHVNESEVLDNVVDSHECNQVKDRFKKSEGYHAVPPPFTRNFKPARADLSFDGLDDSVYKSKVSETITSVPNVETTVTKTSKDSLEKPKTVRFNAPIIEDWESDSEDENMFEPKEFSQNPRDNKRNRNSFEFTKKACFVCGSFNHLIKDCDFHDKKMVQKPVLNNVKKGTGQREVRQVWNNAMRVNHQNFSNSRRDFAPTAILTKSGIVPISAARQSSSRAAAPASAARPINTAAPKPFVNVARPRPNAFHKSHSPSRTPFNQQTALKNRNLNDKVNTAKGNLQYALEDQGIFDSGCSRHMTRNKFYLLDYQDIDGGFVAFGGSSKGGKITRKDEFLVLSPDFKLLDESQVLLKIPRQNNMYSFDLKNVVPSEDLTCLFAKATIDESNLRHRRLGHINFKIMNKLMRGNLVRGLPSKLFENDHTCVACQNGKQHKASYKTKTVSSICKPLQLLHMDLFRPVSVRSINRKSYCLVVTDDFSRFSWVFFLATKDETPEIFKNFITGIENQSYHKVKTIRNDNGTEFKNRIVNEFCKMKGIIREFSVARTPQQNGVAERKNRTLIEAARTMLADSKLPTTFWAEAVNTACYVQNRVLVIKPHNKTPYELFLGKFDGKSDDGFFIGYSINSKAFRVFNTRTRFVEENLHINFLENKPNVAGTGPNWMFDIDTLSMSMNYQPVFAGNQTNDNAEDEIADNAGKKNGVEDPAKEDDINGRARDQRNEFKSVFGQDKDTNSTYRMFTPVSAAKSSYENLGGSTPVNAATPSNADYPTDPTHCLNLEDTC